MAGRNEKKNITKSKIVNYIINNKITSKAELAQNLSLSMPTVLSNVNELIERNMVIEIGEYESTGGRKAKRIGINPAYKYAVGVVITANHLGIVLLNMQYEIEKNSPDAIKIFNRNILLLRSSRTGGKLSERCRRPGKNIRNWNFNPWYY